MFSFFKKGKFSSSSPQVPSKDVHHRSTMGSFGGKMRRPIPHRQDDHGALSEDDQNAFLEKLCLPVGKYPRGKEPFFIVGCVRSGTTLLRDLLRDHPNLECPEETHFFRWSDPFGAPRYKSHYRTKLFREHRELDGIDPALFHYGLNFGKSKEYMAYEYGKEFLKGVSHPDARLFDKTPQNVYGMFFINAVYPNAKFIHIYRHPFNVIASLLEGKVMPKHSLTGAINYWTESMILIEQFKRFLPDQIIEFKYEDVCVNPDPYLKDLLEFVGEDPNLLPSQADKTHPEKNKYKKVIQEKFLEAIKENCEPYFTRYGYEL